MKVYEIYISKISEDLGIWLADERIAVVSSKEKVEKKIAEFKEEKEKGAFWINYKTEKVNGKREIVFKVNEVEVE